MSFESNIERLEEIVARLGDEALELDEALALFEQGVSELRSATSHLTRAEARVKALSEAAEGVFAVDDLDD